MNKILNQEIPGRFFATVTLGVYPKLLKAVSDRKLFFYNDPDTRKVVGKIEINPKLEKIDLWEVRLDELGFTKNPRYDDIYEHAKKYGFEKCPAEAGVLARINVKDEFWRVRRVCMELIKLKNGPSFYLLLKSTCLKAEYEYVGGTYFDVSGVFLFIRPESRQYVHNYEI